MSDHPTTATARTTPTLWLVLLAAGGIFALTMGARQSMGLFLSAINSSTGLGLASMSLAFAIGQLGWGVIQPFTGMVAGRSGPGRKVSSKERASAPSTSAPDTAAAALTAAKCWRIKPGR